MNYKQQHFAGSFIAEAVTLNYNLLYEYSFAGKYQQKFRNQTSF